MDKFAHFIHQHGRDGHRLCFHSISDRYIINVSHTKMCDQLELLLTANFLDLLSVIVIIKLLWTLYIDPLGHHIFSPYNKKVKER